VTDTIKESDGGTLIARTVDRSRLWAVQTPQSFRVEVIRRALAAVKGKGLIVTDDTAACEQIGQAVKLVESAAPNPKVTRLRIWRMSRRFCARTIKNSTLDLEVW